MKNRKILSNVIICLTALSFIFVWGCNVGIDPHEIGQLMQDDNSTVDKASGCYSIVPNPYTWPISDMDKEKTFTVVGLPAGYSIGVSSAGRYLRFTDVGVNYIKLRCTKPGNIGTTSSYVILYVRDETGKLKCYPDNLILTLC